MSQRVSHIYRLVTVPKIFESFQRSLGAYNARERFVAEIVRPSLDSKILDVGCGPGKLRPFLPRSCDYTGFDLNPAHIAHANETYGDQGRFFVGDASKATPNTGDHFDVIICSAILHHLDDAEGQRLLASLLKLLQPDGRLVTFDPTWLPRQALIAKLLKSLDSGLNIRTPEGYLALVQDQQRVFATKIFRDLLRVPYDHFSMVLKQSAAG